MASGHVSGAVHITGGGFQENLPRSFDSNLTASIDLDSWKRPAVFKWLEAQGNVGAEEMLRTFNCGIGFILFCPPEHVTSVSKILTTTGEHPLIIGELIQRTSEPVVFSGAYT
jgi:phosphoribosylformylglycinamidine cyclo-ligase